jgi:DNA-binding SARP family transcriptional activator
MSAVLLVNQGLMYYEQQDFRRAAPVWEEAYRLAARLGDASIASRDNLACLAMMQGSLGQAHELLERELNSGSLAGNASGLAILAMDLGEVARRQGDPAEAEAWLHQALEGLRPVGEQARIGETLAYLGSLARNRGELQKAQTYFDQSLAYLEKAGYSRLISQVKIGLGLLAAAQGKDAAALNYFRAGLRAALDGRHQLCRVEALEGMAGSLARRGEAERAARWLAVTDAARERIGAPDPPVERERREALDQALRQALGDGRWASLRAEAAALGLEQLTAEALAGEADRAPEVARPPAPPEAGVRVLALGPARVLIGGRALEPADWTYAKAKELFFYLLSRGPATKAQIGLDLWPDASPVQLRSTFHSVLHHLRRALGRPNWIIHSSGVYALNPRQPLDYDVRSFEEHLRQAQQELRTAAQTAGRGRVTAHLEAARALWRGDFLADQAYGDWAVFQREALRQTYLDALLRLADLYFADAHYPAAAAAYRQALGLDSYLELAHRGLMRCYARQGEAAPAVRHYQELRHLLRHELNTTPSSETTLLYERIQRGDDI